MGLKPLFISNQLLSSGMDNEDVRKSVAMILKDDPLAQPNGSPLISPAAKLTPNEPLRSPATGDLQPLRVDVNGHRQPSSTLVSPMDTSSSLVSTALPTPLIDFESNSNCSDSSFPKGDLYPGKGPTDFGGFVAPKASPGFALRSPVHYPHLGPSTSGTNISPLTRPAQQPPPKIANVSSQLAQRRNGDIIRKNFHDKVVRHKSNLKFAIPRCGDLNANVLSNMLKKGKKQAGLPREVDNSLFDENVPEQAKINQRPKRSRLEDPDQTDVSEAEEEEQKNYKKYRAAEKQLVYKSDYARLCLSLEEKRNHLDKMMKDYKSRYCEEPIVAVNEFLPAARCWPYIRKKNRQLIICSKSFDQQVDPLAPSTSKANPGYSHIQRSQVSIENQMMDCLHLMSMVPAFTIRKTLARAPQLPDAKDLEEENIRNGTARRLEKEKRRQKEEERKNNRDSSDYEDTDEDEYYPDLKELTKKKRKRGRPSRLDRSEDHAPSKIGRKNPQVKHAPFETEHTVLDLTQLALSDDKPKYAQIQIPSYSLITDESLLTRPAECSHEYPDLLAQHEYYHPILEMEEKNRYLNPSKKPRISVDKESNGDKTPLPSPVSFVKPTV